MVLDILRDMLLGSRVRAHGEVWIIVSILPHRDVKSPKPYLAIRATDRAPCPVHYIETTEDFLDDAEEATKP